MLIAIHVSYDIRLCKMQKGRLGMAAPFSLAAFKGWR